MKEKIYSRMVEEHFLKDSAYWCSANKEPLALVIGIRHFINYKADQKILVITEKSFSKISSIDQRLKWTFWHMKSSSSSILQNST